MSSPNDAPQKKRGAENSSNQSNLTPTLRKLAAKAQMQSDSVVETEPPAATPPPELVPSPSNNSDGNDDVQVQVQVDVDMDNIGEDRGASRKEYAPEEIGNVEQGQSEMIAEGIHPQSVVAWSNWLEKNPKSALARAGRSGHSVYVKYKRMVSQELIPPPPDSVKKANKGGRRKKRAASEEKANEPTEGHDQDPHDDGNMSPTKKTRGEAPVPELEQIPPMPELEQSPPMSELEQSPPMPRREQSPPMPEPEQSPPMQAREVPDVPHMTMDAANEECENRYKRLKAACDAAEAETEANAAAALAEMNRIEQSKPEKVPTTNYLAWNGSRIAAAEALIRALHAHVEAAARSEECENSFRRHRQRRAAVAAERAAFEAACADTIARSGRECFPDPQ